GTFTVATCIPDTRPAAFGPDVLPRAGVAGYTRPPTTSRTGFDCRALVSDHRARPIHAIHLVQLSTPSVRRRRSIYLGQFENGFGSCDPRQQADNAADVLLQPGVAAALYPRHSRLRRGHVSTCDAGSAAPAGRRLCGFGDPRQPATLVCRFPGT